MFNLTAAILAVAAATAPGAAPPQPAVAPVSAPPAAAAQAAATVDPLDQTVCRHMEETGTRLGGAKVCHTRREWAQMTRDSRRMTEQIQENSQTMRLPAN